MRVPKIVHKLGAALLVCGMSLLLAGDQISAQDSAARDADPGAQQARQIRRAAGQQAQERERADASSRSAVRDSAQRLEQLESKLDVLLREVRQLRQEIRQLASDARPGDNQGRVNHPRRRGGPSAQRPNRNRYAPGRPLGPRPGFIPQGPGPAHPSFGPQPPFAGPFQGPHGDARKHLLRAIPVGTDPVSIQASRALRGLGRMHGVAPRDHHSRRGHSSPRGQEIKVVHISDQGRLACSHLAFLRVPTCATVAPIGVMVDRTINAVPTCATMAPIGVMVDRTINAVPTCATMAPIDVMVDRTINAVPTCATVAPINVMMDRTINAVPTCATTAPIDVMADRTINAVPTCATVAPIDVMVDRTVSVVPTCATVAPIGVMVDRTNRALFNFHDLTWPAATTSAGRIPAVFLEECGHVAR